MPKPRQSTAIACQLCGVEYFPFHSGLRQNIGRFCCPQCFIDWKWQQRKIAIEAGQEVPKRSLRRYLLEKFGRCKQCGIDRWMGRSITLQIHHLNGARNILSNAELRCPNCHSQTENYAGKGSFGTPRKAGVNKTPPRRRAGQVTDSHLP